MLIVRYFDVTYKLKEPNSVSEQWTYNRVREQSVCNNAHSEITYSLKELNSCSIHGHRAEDILQGKRTISV